MTVHITIRSDLRAMQREVKRIGDLPDAKTVALLDAALDAGFTAVKADIHVITGALKASARKSSVVHDGRDQWEGTITVGDNGAVDYAIYEKVREPDEHGDHDFFRPLEVLDAAYVAAIMKGLRG